MHSRFLEQPRRRPSPRSAEPTVRLSRRAWFGAAAGAGLGATLLSGCTWGQPQTAAQAASELTRAVGSEAQTIRLWSTLPFENPQGEAALAALFEAFNVTYPQITVEVSVKSQADIDASLLNLPLPDEEIPEDDPRASLEIPDIVMLRPGATTTSLGGHLLPLQDFLTPTAEANLRFIEESLATTGSLYAMPVGAQAYTLAVNPAVLSRVGLTPGEATASFDALLEACTALAVDGLEPFDIAWLDSDDYLTLLSLFATQVSTREQIRSAASTGVPVANLAASEAYIEQMYAAGCFAPATLQRSGAEELNSYAGGESAFFVAHTAKQMSRIFTSQPDSQLVAFPQVPESKHRDISYGGPALGFGITSASENRAAAGAFMSFLASPEGQQVLFSTTGIVPNLRSLAGTTVTRPEQSYVPFAARVANVSLVNYWPDSVRALMRADAVPYLTDSAAGAALPGRIEAALLEHIAGSMELLPGASPAASVPLGP
ncbi:carbohydrate ABC transporter substrate-binding protein [Micrococcales bacterium 31B]|nr:carbohydrate ABC transporter substrate-binding protein [Micrococcales bacterium 31B]